MARFGYCISVAAFGLGLLGAPALAADCCRHLHRRRRLSRPGGDRHRLVPARRLHGERFPPPEGRHPAGHRGRQARRLPARRHRRLWRGIGYRFNSFLRADVTIDGRTRSRFRDYSSRTLFVEGFNTEAGKLDVLTGLFNVYVDLGTGGLHALCRRRRRHGEQALPRRLDRHHLLHHRLRQRRRRQLPDRGAGLRRRANHTAVGLAWRRWRVSPTRSAPA